MRSIAARLVGVAALAGVAGASLVGCAADAPTAVDDASGAGEEPTAAEDEIHRARTSAMATIDLGAVDIGRPVSFTVPRGALGFTVFVESDSSADYVAVDTIVNPAGQAILSDATAIGGTYPTATGPRGIAAAPIPQGDAPGTAPVPGKWTASFVAFDVTTNQPLTKKLRAKVRVQISDDGRFHGGLLDLHVYIPKGLQIQDPAPLHVVDAATASRDACIKTRIDGFYAAVKSMVGIDRGKVTFHAIPARFVKVDSQAALEDLFSESRVVPDEPSLHFMLSNNLETFPGSPAWGVAAGIGGAASHTGTPLSGVALAVGGFPAKGDSLTMLHEAGHFIGLNHTSELAGGMFDPISDTPQCVGISNENFMHCTERRNLMFPVYYGGSEGGIGVNLSPGQVRTFRGSPVYRAYRR